MEKLTIGQVIEKLQVDEVALVIKNEEDCNIDGYMNLASGIHYDVGDNNILKTLDGDNFTIAKTSKGDETHFVIVKKELYNLILGIEVPTNLKRKFVFTLENQISEYYAELKGDTYNVKWKNNDGTWGNMYYDKNRVKRNIENGSWIILRNIKD